MLPPCLERETGGGEPGQPGQPAGQHELSPGPAAGYSAALLLCCYRSARPRISCPLTLAATAAVKNRTASSPAAFATISKQVIVAQLTNLASTARYVWPILYEEEEMHYTCLAALRAAGGSCEARQAGAGVAAHSVGAHLTAVWCGSGLDSAADLQVPQSPHSSRSRQSRCPLATQPGSHWHAGPVCVRCHT